MHKWNNYSFSFLSGRLLFDNKVETEIVPPPSITERGSVETLQDAWEEAQELIAKNNARLKEILEYYENNPALIPPTVKVHYDNCLALRGKLEEYMKRLVRLRLIIPNRARSVSDEEKTIRDTTIKNINDVYAGFWSAQKEHERTDVRIHDPSKTVYPVTFLGQTTRFGGSGRKPANAGAKTVTPDTESGTDDAASKKPERKEAAPGTNEYILQRWADIARLLMEKSRTGTGRDMTKDERNSLLFIAKGESKEVIVGGQTYALERDLTSNYIRLRNFVTGNPRIAGGDSRDQNTDPFISINAAEKRPPVWKNLSTADLEVRQLDKRKKTLSKQMAWLTSEATPPGSRVTFSHLDTFLIDPDGAEKRIIRISVEITKQYDGTLRVRETEYSAIRRDKKKTDKRPLIDDVKIREHNLPPFADASLAMDHVRERLGTDSQVAVAKATPEELLAEENTYEIERKLAEERIQKQFKSLAETLAVEESTLFQPPVPERKRYRDDGKYEEAVTEYKTKLSEHEERRLKARTNMIAFLQKHPTEATLTYEPVRVTVTVKNGELSVSGILSRGNEPGNEVPGGGQRMARRYKISNGEEIV